MKYLLFLLIPSLMYGMAREDQILFSLSGAGDLGRVKQWFARNPHKKPRNKLGHTAIHKAVKNAHKRVARYLIKKVGLDPSEKTIHSETALHIAAANPNNSKLVDYLLGKKRMDLYAISDFGTFGQIAVRAGAKKVLDVLVKHAAKRSFDPQDSKKRNWCPVCMECVKKEWYDVASYKCMHFICKPCKYLMQDTAALEWPDGAELEKCPLCRTQMFE